MAPYFKLFGTVIGKKHVPLIPSAVGTLFCYGAAASYFLMYMADIEQVMKYVPFYRDSFRFPYEDDKRVYILPRKDL